MKQSPAMMALLALALAACQRGGDGNDAAADEARAAFVQAEADWRADREARLLAADGWASLVGLHWVDEGAHYVGSSGNSGIRLSMGPPDLGLLTLDDGAISFQPAQGAGVTVDGVPATGAVALHDDTAEDGPSVIGFDGGDGKATVIQRDGRTALRVRHAQAPSRTQFAGLDYWPADPHWLLQARFVPNPPGSTIEIADVIGGVAPVPNPGAVEFTRDGKTYRIQAIDEGGDELFLVFADRTNGHGSYGAGRFLYVPKPDADGVVPVDFNRAYNPPCAFTAFATCPLPPPENRLDLEVTAGEKAYAKSPHA
jgi:uncharacterized protein (DUF1684 family)